MMRVAELEKQLLQREKELESIKVPSNLEKGVSDGYWVPGPGDLAFLSLSFSLPSFLPSFLFSSFLIFFLSIFLSLCSFI